VYVLRDYLKPDAYEIYGLFPARLVDWIMPLFRGRKTWHLELTPKTNSFWGILTFWFLTLFVPLRPWSYRARDEWRCIGEYRQRVFEFLAIDYQLAVLMADTGQMTKGYGQTRRKTRSATQRYVDNIVRPLVELERDSGSYELTLATAATLRKVIASDDPGIDTAEELAREVVARARLQSPEQLLRYVSAAPKNELVTIQPATKPAVH